MSESIITQVSHVADQRGEEPTAYLKFVDGKLHQRWNIGQMQYGKLWVTSHEWRAVATDPAIRKETEE